MLYSHCFKLPNRLSPLLPAFLLLASLVFSSCPALARPEYADREARACQYCHVDPNPGKIDTKTRKRFSTERNEKGLYYGNHNHTFKDYVEKKTNNPLPQLTYVWREEFRDLPTRVVSADVTGDGVLRLVSLHENSGDKNAAILKIRKWSGTAFVLEFSTEIKGSPKRLAVGRFAGKKAPCQIVTEDALFVWNGKTYQRRSASKPIAVFGITRQKDDSERLLVADSPDSVKAFRVDSSATGEWLIDPIDPPASKEVVWRDMHADSGFFEKMGFPTGMSIGDAMGLWTLPKMKSLYLYQLKETADFDSVPNPENPKKLKVVFNGRKIYSITIRDINTGLECWGTPQIEGIAYDVALDDPRNGGKPGLLTLFGESTSLKPRIVYFFQFD